MNLRGEVNSRFNVARWMGDEALVSCPHPEHDDENPSASINIRKRLWVCYSCGKGGSLQSLFGQRIADPDVEDLLTEIATSLAGFDSPVHGYPESWLDQFDAAGIHPYWKRRGLSDAACRVFRLGYDPSTGKATYPLRGPSGAVLGVVRRSVDNSLPKYLYPDHAPVSETLFAYYLYREGVTKVVLVEGALDAIALWDAGIPAVAQMGARLSQAQVGLLARLGPRIIYLGYDQDDAGERAEKLALSMLDFCPVKVMSWDPEMGKDPLDLSVGERRRAFHEAELVSM